MARSDSDAPPDVTFILLSEDEEETEVLIPAHRDVLAKASSPFRCMLQGDFVESRTDQVVVRGVCPDTFRSLVNFIYTGKLESQSREWPLKDVLRLLMAADRYEVKALSTEMITQIGSHLSVQTLWEILAVADALSVSQPSLLSACEQFLAEHLGEVADAGNSRFEQCPERVVLKILSRDSLPGVQCEADVYRAAVRWLEADIRRSRDKALRRVLMECVRFPCMTSQEFSQLARRSELVEESLEREALGVFSGLAQLSSHWPCSPRHAPRLMGRCSLMFAPLSCEETRVAMAADRHTAVCVTDGPGNVFVRQPLLACLERRQAPTVWRLDLQNCVRLPSIGVAVYNTEGQFMAACGLSATSPSSTVPAGSGDHDLATCSFQRVSLTMDPVTGDFVTEGDACSLHFGRSASISFLFSLESECPAGCAIRTQHRHARLFSSVLTPRQHTSLAFLTFPPQYHVCPYIGLRPGMIATIGQADS